MFPAGIRYGAARDEFDGLLDGLELLLPQLLALSVISTTLLASDNCIFQEDFVILLDTLGGCEVCFPLGGICCALALGCGFPCSLWLSESHIGNGVLHLLLVCAATADLLLLQRRPLILELHF